MRWWLNGTLVSVRSDTSATAGNIMLGYMDVFASVASPAADNFIIYDNVRVEQLPQTDCNANEVPDACEYVYGGDFDADGDVDADDLIALSETLAGPGNTPTLADPTCLGVYLDAFDTTGDNDVDLADFANIQQAPGA